MDEILTGVLQNGFSVAVAAFLLVRMEARLDHLAEAISDLRSAITAQRAEAAGDR